MSNLAIALWLYGAWPDWWKNIRENRARLRSLLPKHLPSRYKKKQEFAELVRPRWWRETTPVAIGPLDADGNAWRAARRLGLRG